MMPCVERGLLVRVCQFVAMMLFIGCSQKETPIPATESIVSHTKTIRVAAAADLKFAFPDLIAAFQIEHPEIQVEATFGSSGSFFAQLSNQAPFDLFLSADMGYPRKLIEQGYAEKNSEFQYAVGHVGLWVRNESTLAPDKIGVEVLKDPTVQKIALANPKHAPYGRAAEAALKTLNVYDQVEGRLVFGENVAQASQFAESGAAEVGLIAQSLAVSSALRDKGRFWPFPEDSYPELEQGGIVLKWAQDPSACGQFRDFLLSDSGRAVLRRYGLE